MKKAVILLSGGLDSAVAGYQARQDIGQKGELYALSVLYGQRHAKELVSAFKIGEELAVACHSVNHIEFGESCSALIDTGRQIRTSGVEFTNDIPDTWVPQRNSILLAMAFAYAEIVDADLVYTGFNIVDYSGYPDCRPEFVRAEEKALNLASKRFVNTGRGFSIMAPLLNKTKSDIVKRGIALGTMFELTWSCYMGADKACGVCDSCRIRREAFHINGIEDPIEYEELDNV